LGGELLGNAELSAALRDRFAGRRDGLRHAGNGLSPDLVAVERVDRAKLLLDLGPKFRGTLRDLRLGDTRAHSREGHQFRPFPGHHAARRRPIGSSMTRRSTVDFRPARMRVHGRNQWLD
jgi:hypothetical protein